MRSRPAIINNLLKYVQLPEQSLRLKCVITLIIYLELSPVNHSVHGSSVVHFHQLNLHKQTNDASEKGKNAGLHVPVAC